MARTKIKYAPCSMNPMTEKPYSRHKWEIVQGVFKTKGNLVTYAVRCARCGLNDPRPPAY